ILDSKRLVALEESIKYLKRDSPERMTNLNRFPVESDSGVSNVLNNEEKNAEVVSKVLEVVGDSGEEASSKPSASEQGIPPTPVFRPSPKEHKGFASIGANVGPDKEKKFAEVDNEEIWSESEGGISSDSGEDNIDETVVKPKEPLVSGILSSCVKSEIEYPIPVAVSGVKSCDPCMENEWKKQVEAIVKPVDNAGKVF
ncbi:hypothetical protein U1Q18_032718, partial [Sarracenia purpurea var. burkii]